MTVSRTSLPWRIFLPIVMMTGLTVSVWGGLTLEERAESNKINEITLQTERQQAVLQQALGQLESRSSVLSGLYAASTAVTDPEFATVVKRLQADVPAVEAAYYLTKTKKGWQATRAYPKADNRILQAVAATNITSNTPQVLPINTENHLLLTETAQNGRSLIAVAFNLQPFLQALSLEQAEMLHATVISREQGDVLLSFNLGEKQTDNPFVHTESFHWAGTTWTLDWAYPRDMIKPVFWPGKAAMLLGILITLAFGWAVWLQYSVAARVRREVIERTNELEQASRRFRLITDNAYDLIAIVNRDGSFEYINSAYNRVLGYSRRELLNQQLEGFVQEDDAIRLKRSLEEVVSGKPVSEITFRMAHKSGGWVHLEAVMKGLFNSDWTLGNIVVHCRDITARKKFADELARSEQRFRDFADSSADWLWEVNPSYEFTYVSPGVKGTLGYGADEMIGRNQFEALFGREADSVKDLLKNLIERRQPYRDIEFWTRTKMGERVCLRISGVPVLDENQAFTGYRGAATNITSSKLDQENMLRLATTDHLTGLLNRNRFTEELERTVGLAKRHNTQGILLFLDMDRFKAVNDTHGHDAGDAMIREFAKVVRKTMRSTDIVARLGGDEFGIIMHNISLEDAEPKVRDLVRKIGQMRVDYKGARLQVTTSVGMVPFPQASKDASQLIISADLAMYRAKETGRNRIFVDLDNDSQHLASSSVRAQLEWVERLRVSLEKDDFELHFQPMLPSHKSDDLIFEALVRLRDENGQLGAPSLFIDAAEHFGLIRELDMAVIDRSVKTQAELAAKGMDVMISVNISGLSFGDAEVMKVLKRSLEKYKANPSRMIFEVTETAAMRDLGDAKAFVSELKKLGCKFALDDFGVGFSSFYYIKHLDVDYLKIDGSYIKNLHTSPEDRLFVKSLVDLAAGLNIKTVAEFVENEEILDELKKLNVTYAQGFYVNRPDQDITSMYARLLGKTTCSDLNQ